MTNTNPIKPPFIDLMPEYQRILEKYVHRTPPIDHKLIIMCPHRYDAVFLFLIFKMLDVKWASGEYCDPDDTMWNSHKLETCYMIQYNPVTKKNILTYSGSSFVERIMNYNERKDVIYTVMLVSAFIKNIEAL